MLLAALIITAPMTLAPSTVFVQPKQLRISARCPLEGQACSEAHRRAFFLRRLRIVPIA